MPATSIEGLPQPWTELLHGCDRRAKVEMLGGSNILIVSLWYLGTRLVPEGSFLPQLA